MPSVSQVPSVKPGSHASPEPAAVHVTVRPSRATVWTVAVGSLLVDEISSSPWRGARTVTPNALAGTVRVRVVVVLQPTPRNTVARVAVLVRVSTFVAAEAAGTPPANTAVSRAAGRRSIWAGNGKVQRQL